MRNKKTRFWYSCRIKMRRCQNPQISAGQHVYQPPPQLLQLQLLQLQLLRPQSLQLLQLQLGRGRALHRSAIDLRIPAPTRTENPAPAQDVDEHDFVNVADEF